MWLAGQIRTSVFRLGKRWQLSTGNTVWRCLSWHVIIKESRRMPSFSLEDRVRTFCDRAVFRQE